MDRCCVAGKGGKVIRIDGIHVIADEGVPGDERLRHALNKRPVGLQEGKGLRIAFLHHAGALHVLVVPVMGAVPSHAVVLGLEPQAVCGAVGDKVPHHVNALLQVVPAAQIPCPVLYFQ